MEVTEAGGVVTSIFDSINEIKYVQYEINDYSTFRY